MAKFGNRSRKTLETCHEDLQKIMSGAIEIIDFSVLEGHRTLSKQLEYFEDGKSKLDGIKKKSKHQSKPSMAVDIAPYPIDWQDHRRFYFLAGVVIAVADVLAEMGEISHKIRWGGDWDSDFDFKDQNFNDLPHFELVS